MDLVSNTISLGSSTIALGSSTIVSWVFAIWGSAYTTSLRLGLHLGGEYMYASEERAGPGSQIKHSSEWLVHSKECLVSLASYWLHTPAFGCLHTWYWWPMLLAEYPTPSIESPNYWSDKDLFSHLRFSLELSKFSPSMNFPWARFSERRWRHDLFPCDFPICLVSKVSLNALLPGIHSTGIISSSVSSLEYLPDISLRISPRSCL